MINELANGISLNYEKLGTGNPLLLLHGNGDSHKSLIKLANALSSEHEVYLIDSRGHGDSSNHGEYFVYEDLAEDIDLFITELGLKNVSILGHSDGAIVATLLAIDKKPDLKKLILCGLSLSKDDVSDDIKAWVKSEYEKTGNPLFKLMLEEPNIELESLRNIEVPALIVAGESEVMPRENYLAIVETIENAKYHEVSGEDHISYLLDTDVFAPVALDYLKD